jgi:hypothetical protein
MYKQGISEKRLLRDDREAGNRQRRGLRDTAVHILKRFYPRFTGTDTRAMIGKYFLFFLFFKRINEK